MSDLRIRLTLFYFIFQFGNPPIKLLNNKHNTLKQSKILVRGLLKAIHRNIQVWMSLRDINTQESMDLQLA